MYLFAQYAERWVEVLRSLDHEMSRIISGSSLAFVLGLRLRPARRRKLRDSQLSRRLHFAHC